MSPFRSIPLIMLLLMPLLGQGQNINKSGYELLWKVSHDSLEQESCLFRTIHLSDKRAFEFPDSLRFLLRNVERNNAAQIFTLQANCRDCSVAPPTHSHHALGGEESLRVLEV